MDNSNMDYGANIEKLRSTINTDTQRAPRHAVD